MISYSQINEENVMTGTMLTQTILEKGFPSPLGPTRTQRGINFSVVSTSAKKVSLVLKDHEIPLHRTGGIWHGHLETADEQVLYAYRKDESDQLLLDPYAKAIDGKWCIAQATTTFDWGNITKPNYPLADLVIYEMHVRGFTAQLGEGTFLAIREKIPYLKSLGINAVELMPIFFFDPFDTGVETVEQNYWGYAPIHFFAPFAPYGSIEEFKQLVYALHENGIEVLLDVVYNHTGEKGSGRSLMGLDEATYFLLDEDKHHKNYSGCGNTLDVNHPVTTDLIRASLRYWATECQVDGFRFDLASAMHREGAPSCLEAISNDPELADVKLIAEPWDAMGHYQLGHFMAHTGRWAEWNGQYRDEVRKFLNQHPSCKKTFANRLAGSPDLFRAPRSAAHSINFITCHDGFSLRDLVSYNQKHNESNKEENRDGCNHNESWNCGVEGETDDPKILHLRERQIKTFILLLMVSKGTPLVLMGDEYGHTRLGNNNPWCQDGPINWQRWDNDESTLRSFFEKALALRQSLPLLRDANYRDDEFHWHGLFPHQPEWETDDRLIAFTRQSGTCEIYCAINGSQAEKTFCVPEPKYGPWHVLSCTSNASPDDLIKKSEAKAGRYG